MAFRKLPEQQVLLRQFIYDPETGSLTRRSNGRAITGTQRDGYIIVGVDGVTYLAHRVIWKLVTGEDPEFMDHIDGVRNRNRLANLRSVTKSENGRNTKRLKTNTSGVVGVHWANRDKVWIASIHERQGGKRRMFNLGSFTEFSEAVDARMKAEIERGFHPNHGREAAFEYETKVTSRKR